MFNDDLLIQVDDVNMRDFFYRNDITVIGITGRMRQGKSTIALELAKQGYYEVAFAEPIKWGICQMLDMTMEEIEEHKTVPIPWLGVTSRHIMQIVGTEAMRNKVHPDIWVKLAARRIKRLYEKEGIKKFVISDVRFDSEAAAVSRGMDGVIWHVEREPLSWLKQLWSQLFGHESERGVDPRWCDLFILNDGTEEHLRYTVSNLTRMPMFANPVSAFEFASNHKEAAVVWPRT